MFRRPIFENINLKFGLPIVLLCIIGALVIFSSTYPLENKIANDFWSQLGFYAVGFGVYLLLQLVGLNRLKHPLVIGMLALITITLLVLVLIVGIDIYGAKRWIFIAGVSLQPSELAKLSIIVVTAFTLAPTNKSVKKETLLNIYSLEKFNLKQTVVQILKSEDSIKFFLNLLFVFVVTFLIVLEKSLGNTVLLLTIFLTMHFSLVSVKPSYLYWLGILCVFLSFNFGVLNLEVLGEFPIFCNLNITEVIIFALIVLLTLVFLNVNKLLILVSFLVVLASFPLAKFAYDNVLADYQKQRIETFFSHDQTNDLTQNWNLKQSLNAVASGGLVGKGFLKGEVVNNGFLPFASTDFVFATFAEQFGFIGCLLLLGLYSLLIFNIIKIGANSYDTFSYLICLGVATLISLNTIQHIGMNIGVLPITGVPLPLISSGGSAILTIFIGLGLVNLVRLNNESSNETNITKLKF